MNPIPFFLVSTILRVLLGIECLLGFGFGLPCCQSVLVEARVEFRFSFETYIISIYTHFYFSENSIQKIQMSVY